MGKMKEGAKAGIIAGTIYAIIGAAVTATLEYAFKSGIMRVINLKISSATTANINALYDITVAGSVVVAVVFGIIAGLVLGLIFGAVSNRIPGKRLIVKGLLFGFMFWLILHVLADLLNLQYGETFYFIDIGLGLATTLLYGTLLGMFFERRMKRLAPPVLNR